MSLLVVYSFVLLLSLLEIVVPFDVIDRLPQHCSITKMSANNVTSNASSYALIPYNKNGVLSEFYQPKKTYYFPSLQKSFMIKQDWSHNGVAGVVWEAAHVLSEYLIANVDLNDKNVIELGAGTGLVGMTAAMLGADVTCTDMKTALPLLNENIDLNFKHTNVKLSVHQLEWGKDHKRFKNCFYDYILGADIIYLESAFNVLLDTLWYLANSGESKRITKILLSSKLRYNRVETFLAKLKTKFSSVKLVYEEKLKNIVIYECFNEP